MSQIFMMTVPRTVHKKILKIMIAENDVKRWIIGWETGHGGYEHYQIRLETSNPGFFLWLKLNIPTAHAEQSKVWVDYECKDGYYISSRDTNAIRKVRFQPLRPMQRQILDDIRKQGDREIDVYYDPTGSHGKTFLSLQLWERRRALVIPRSAITSARLEGFILSAYEKMWYDIIIIDIPRAGKIPDDLYESMEEIKDGLVSDWRYTARQCNIRGAKLIVFTNKKLDEKKLSRDRWKLHGIKADGSLSS